MQQKLSTALLNLMSLSGSFSRKSKYDDFNAFIPLKENRINVETSRISKKQTVGEWVRTDARLDSGNHFIAPTKTWELRLPSGQGIGSWQACHEFKPSTTKDPQCRATMHANLSRAETSSC
ncbi:hypothetical protein TNCV_4650341 [Trichonephila clavipes]|nr:hypothetical protein TNCV_4650341 [Trichonephila clavipes]